MRTDLESLERHHVDFWDDILVDATRIMFTDRTITHSKNGSVDLRRVVGCMHPSYSDHSWGSLTPWLGGQLQRGADCLANAKRRPDYYFDDSPKKYWSFLLIDDKLFIEEGVHRTVMARFLAALNDIDPIVRGVTIAVASNPNRVV